MHARRGRAGAHLESRATLRGEREFHRIESWTSLFRPESKLLCRDRPLTFEPAESEPGVRTLNTQEESARRASGNKLSHSPRVPGTCASANAPAEGRRCAIEAQTSVLRQSSAECAKNLAIESGCRRGHRSAAPCRSAAPALAGSGDRPELAIARSGRRLINDL